MLLLIAALQFALLYAGSERLVSSAFVVFLLITALELAAVCGSVTRVRGDRVRGNHGRRVRNFITA